MRTILLGFIAGLIIVLNQNAIAKDFGSESVLLASDRHSEVVNSLETEVHRPVPSPIANRLAAAESARKTGNPELAISIFREILMLEPENLEARIKWAATLADMGKFDEARAHLERIQKSRPDWVQAYLTRGALERQAMNELSALKAFDQALAIEPENLEAREGRLIAISRLGSPALALEEAKQYPKLDPALIQRLHEDEAALSIRRSENSYHEKPVDGLRASEPAIRLIETNLQRYPKSERSRFDYVRALSNRYRYQDAITAYEALKREKKELPGYTHRAAGLSYLAERKPEQAAEAFKAALAADPNDFNASVGLFYALSDLADFPAARAHIDALAARPLEPEKKFEAEIHAAWGRAFEDRLGIAQDQFLALQARAPASFQLHNALGKIYIWRGWPRRAEKEFELVAQNEKDNLSAEVGLADTDFGLGNFRSAARRIAHLNMLAPDDQNVKRVNRIHTLHNLNELALTVSTSRNKDRVINGQSLSFDARIYGTPIDFQNRIFAHQYFESSRFESGSAYYKRWGVGLESTIPHVAKLEGEIQQEFFGRKRLSAAVEGIIDLSDFWRIKGRFDSNSVDVPIRARVDGIRGQSLHLSSSYRWSESAAIEAGTQQVSMSDGNTRRNVFMTGQNELVQGPFYKARWLIDLISSTNTLKNPVYFNPGRDRTLQLTLKNEWLGFRRYESSFYQRLYLSVGSYAQQDFALQTIGSLRYEHEWSINNVTNVRYSLAYVKRAFDGTPSAGSEAMLSLSHRF